MLILFEVKERCINEWLASIQNTTLNLILRTYNFIKQDFAPNSTPGVLQYQAPVKAARFISYLGMKSWDLQVCDRASTITHVDREKKNGAY